MDRLVKLARQQFASQMKAEVRRILEQVGDAVNDAPQGNVINGPQVHVRDLMGKRRQRVYQTAAHMRVDASSKTPGEQTAVSQRRSDKALHTVRDEGYEPFLNRLLDRRRHQRGSKRETPDRLLNYAAERQETICYQECQQQGWDIGSGTIESMCGATAERIKGRGRQ
jgi:hypothetical protein